MKWLLLGLGLFAVVKFASLRSTSSGAATNRAEASAPMTASQQLRAQAAALREQAISIAAVDGSLAQSLEAQADGLEAAAMYREMNQMD
jgi:hypothetical protein